MPGNETHSVQSPAVLYATLTLRSPLFIAATIFNVLLGVFLALSTASWPSGIALCMAAELICAIVVWQYMVNSVRFDALEQTLVNRSGMTSNLQYLSRLIREVSSDQSRVLEAVQAVEKAAVGSRNDVAKSVSQLADSQADAAQISMMVGEGHEALKKILEDVDLDSTRRQKELNRVLEDVQHGLRGISSRTRELVQRSLDQEKSLRDQESRLNDVAPVLALAEQLVQEMAVMRERLEAFPAQQEAHGKEWAGQVSGLIEAQHNEALSMAVALDRLNLELRRQMTLLRRERGGGETNAL